MDLIKTQGFNITLETDTILNQTFHQAGYHAIALTLSAEAILAHNEWYFTRWLLPPDTFLLQEHLPNLSNDLVIIDNLIFLDNDLAQQYFTLYLWFEHFKPGQLWGAGIYLKHTMGYLVFGLDATMPLDHVYHVFISETLDAKPVLAVDTMLDDWINAGKVSPFRYHGSVWFYHQLPLSQLATWFDYVLPFNVELVQLLTDRYHDLQQADMTDLISAFTQGL